jgi:hypothetical protein
LNRAKNQSEERGKIGEVGLPLRDGPISRFFYSHFVLNEMLRRHRRRGGGELPVEQVIGEYPLYE